MLTLLRPNHIYRPDSIAIPLGPQWSHQPDSIAIPLGPLQYHWPYLSASVLRPSQSHQPNPLITPLRPTQYPQPAPCSPNSGPTIFVGLRIIYDVGWCICAYLGPHNPISQTFWSPHSGPHNTHSQLHAQPAQAWPYLLVWKSLYIMWGGASVHTQALMILSVKPSDHPTWAHTIPMASFMLSQLRPDHIYQSKNPMSCGPTTGWSYGHWWILHRLGAAISTKWLHGLI